MMSVTEKRWFDTASYWHKQALAKKWESDHYRSLSDKLSTQLRDIALATAEKRRDENHTSNKKRKRSLISSSRYRKPASLELKSRSKQVIQSIRGFKDIAGLKDMELDSNLVQIRQLQNLIPAAANMDRLIGLNGVKRRIFQMVINQLFQAIMKESSSTLKKQGLMNICIVGPPGTGKTSLAMAMCKLFAATGMLSKGHVVVATRDDFVGKYLGHTTPKARALMESAKGGVLLIDEAYVMSGDKFAKDAVDTINECMSLYAEDLLVIIAGYKDEINSQFFGQNKGLARRFPVVLELTGYSGEDLGHIFERLMTSAGWSTSVSDGVKIKRFITAHHREYTHHAGDMGSVFLHSQFEASGRIWASTTKLGALMVFKDVKRGHEQFLKSKKDNNPPECSDSCRSLYG